ARRPRAAEPDHARGRTTRPPHPPRPPRHTRPARSRRHVDARPIGPGRRRARPLRPGLTRAVTRPGRRVRVPVADPGRDDDAADHRVYHRHQYYHHSHQYHDTDDDQRAAATTDPADPDHRRSDRHPHATGPPPGRTAVPRRSPGRRQVAGVRRRVTATTGAALGVGGFPPDGLSELPPAAATSTPAPAPGTRGLWAHWRAHWRGVQLAA